MTYKEWEEIKDYLESGKNKEGAIKMLSETIDIIDMMVMTDEVDGSLRDFAKSNDIELGDE